MSDPTCPKDPGSMEQGCGFLQAYAPDEGSG